MTQAWVSGTWRDVELLGVSVAGDLVPAEPVHPADLTMVELAVSGTTLAPAIELSAAADVTWWDLDHEVQLGAGLAPSLSIAGVTRVGLAVLDAGRPAYERVTTVNLGFNSNDDAGRDNIGPSYDRAAQPVTGVRNLRRLTGLRRFLAANGTLTGHVDLSGLAHLEFVECFSAEVSSVNLTGCASLIRLCLEQNRVGQLDLNPVRTTLRDLRAAEQHAISTLTFTTLDGPMTALWHYCIRDQTVLNIIPMSQLPVIEQHWAWNTNQSASAAPVSDRLNSLISYSNTYDQPSVDRILAGLVTLGSLGGLCDLQGSASPSSTGAAAATTLRGRGWTVNTS